MFISLTKFNLDQTKASSMVWTSSPCFNQSNAQISHIARLVNERGY